MLPDFIPTDDAQAALQFCRALANALEQPSESFTSTRDRRLSSSRASDSRPEMRTSRPTVSVVIPVFNEQDNLTPLHEHLTTVLSTCVADYEIVFVDDGSQDQSASFLATIADRDPRVAVVELSRNFGHQVAVSAGLDHCRGDGVIIMDADMQDPPEVLPEFIAKWREGYDVVYAVRQTRKESLVMRAAYAGFYRLLQRIANIQMPLDSGDFCIMDRRVVDILVNMPERNRFIRGIRSWVGLRQVGLPYARHARHAGKSKYSLARLIYLALDGLISFSFLPLRLISLLGLAVSFVSVIMAGIYAIQKLTVDLGPPGFPTLVVALLFLSGAQLITIGVIGEYVGRIFDEVKRRPLYVIRRVVQREQ